MEEESPIGSEELNSDLGGLKTERISELKRNIIIGSVITLGVIMLIVVIIILATSGKNEKNDDTPKESFGQIECEYDVEVISAPISILSEDFNSPFSLSIVIGDNTIKYSKTYQFSKTGKNTVKFLIHEQSISVDKMFKI